MNKCVILQVEDDDRDVFFLSRAFKVAGIENLVKVANDGQQAIDYLSGAGEFCDRHRFPLPGLIILDLKLPRRNGFEVLDWLRKRSGLCCLTVIVFSSSPLEREIERAYELGANSYVVKPHETEDLQRFAKALRDYWLQFHAFSVVQENEVVAAQ